MEKNYLDQFKNPPSDFRGAPFWAWNCKLDKQTILKQIDYFNEMGMGGFTMHCRTGLDTPYLGKEYMDIVKACVQKAKQLKMKACLYDEDRWPSGSSGGLVTKDHRYRSRYLVFTPFERENGNLLMCYQISLANGYLADYKILKDTEKPDSGCDVWFAYLEVAGDSPWFNDQAYVDTLNKEAIEKFIEITYDAYRDSVGEEFGKTVPSIFTDEPQFTCKGFLGRADEKRDILLPYTDDFEDTYANTYGDSFLNYLPEVFWELPDGKVSVTRYRYHDHLTERFAQSFSDTIGSWCEKNNISLTGHMMEEPSLHSQTASIGEAMRHYRGFQIPGIDMLCDWREYSTAKQAQSAAHQFGRNEITSELYGVTNWDFDFRGHKLQGDWQAALGVTHRVHHLSWVSMEGEAKRDYPASIFYQSTWYKKYKQIEDYFARVNTAMQSGKPVARIGVIHPIESYWICFGPDEQTVTMRTKLQQQFEQVTNWMLFGLMDFDFISESLLAEYGNADKQLHVGEMAYDVVVVPGCKTLRKSTVAKLDAFVKAGGKVIFMGDIPELVDAVPDTSAAKLASRAEHIDFNYDTLMNALADYRSVDMRNPRGVRTDRYLYQMRKLGDDKILFIANGKHTCNRDLANHEIYTITLDGLYDVTLLDPMTGESKKCPAVYTDRTTVINADMFEQDSLLLYLTNGKRTEAISADISHKTGVFTTALHTVKSYKTSEPNVLMLDQAEYSLDGEDYRASEEILRIDNVLRRKLGYPLKMDALAQPWTQTKTETAQHSLTLKYTVLSDIDISGVKLAVERPELMDITLNGTEIDTTANGYFVDECIKTLDIPEIKQGENEIVIKMPYSAKTNLEWCYLLGDFGVRIFGNRAKITEKQQTIGFSDLVGQSFPFLAGNMTYQCDVEIEDGEYELEITKFRSPLISVSVDGTDKGDIMISPYRVSLGHLSGKHSIEITAYGNRVNTFGPVHCCDEEIRWYGPNAWRLDGNQFSYEYQLKQSGILSAPKLYKMD